ncbi:MAG: phosphate acyltransferase PlsX [Synergistaceae bacterium]|nr:phosphate acyltransferase PlsX [Synergistaceae bacterium]
MKNYNNITIAIDAMGGDNAPHEICKGTQAACKEFDDTNFALVGDTGQIKKCLEGYSASDMSRISIVHADDFIEMDDNPTLSIRKKRRSSMRLAMEMVRSGEAQGVVSAGNTGAIVVGGVLVVGRLPSIDRPALGVPLPTVNRSTFLLDVGASVRCKTINLYQYALMGNIYSHKVLGVDNPMVSLLSNGSEDIKGDDVVSEAREMLLKTNLNYTGYIEGNDIVNGTADVVVCDGFMGNVVLKFGEGIMSAAHSIIKEEMGQRFLPKIGMIFMFPMVKALWNRFNYEKYGGTPLLGVDGVVIKAHGRSKAPAILSALKTARNLVKKEGVELIRKELE